MGGLTNAQLIDQLAEMTKRATTAEARVETLTTDLAAANEKADTAAQARKGVEGELDKARGEIADLNKSLKAYRGSATKARNAAEVLRKQLSPEARPLGALKAPKTPEEAADRAELVRHAIAGGPTEVVFSDGRREIRELAPLLVAGAFAWRELPAGMVLNAEPVLEPGDCQRQQMEIRGFALLDELGQQVGWCPLAEPIVVMRNQRVMLPHNTIRF